MLLFTTGYPNFLSAKLQPGEQKSDGHDHYIQARLRYGCPGRGHDRARAQGWHYLHQPFPIQERKSQVRTIHYLKRTLPRAQVPADGSFKLPS